MTNLSDLFPAGAGKQVSFVADGAIGAAGKPVILTAAGKVTPVSGIIEVLTSPVNASTEYASYLSSAYGNGKILLMVHMAGSPYTTYGIVGTISGGAVTYGTPVALADNIGASSPAVGVAYDSVEDKFVISYCGGTGTYATGVVATVSGTAVSYGTPVVVASYSSRIGAVGYDANEEKVVLAWTKYSNDDGYAAVGTVSGTSISYGSEVIFPTSPDSMYRTKGFAYDANAQKLVLSWSQTNGHVVVLSISGTTLSYGTAVQFDTGGTAEFSALAYDSVAQKCVVTWKSDAGSPAGGCARVVTVSGTSITLGTTVAYNSSNAQYQSIAYDATADRSIITYAVGSTAKQYIIKGTVSGTNISYAAALEIASNNEPTTVVYDSVAGKCHIAYGSGYTDVLGLVFTAGYTNLTATNFIGISDAAILDTASGNVTIKGGIAATGLTSLTPGSDYYAQDDGTITTATAGKKIGKAMSATSINLEYQS